MKLTVVAPAPAHPEGDSWWLDTKFVTGMERYVRDWPGPVAVMLAETPDKPPFASCHRAADLPFALSTYRPGDPVPVARLPEEGLVLCGGDEAEFLHLAAACAARGQPLVFVVEYTLETRIRIAWLDRGRNVLRKLRTTQWSLSFEARRRAALRAAAGVQFNAYPAFDALGHLNGRSMMYHDGRVTGDLLVTGSEQNARAERLLRGDPLTLVHSGRLETLKGAQDLVPLAERLGRRGVGFVLHIFGAGSLSAEMQQRIGENGLSDRVILHGPVDFAQDLVPFARQSCDLFISCHRQSDPSCTYLETLGCGVPVVGYANRMWSRMQAESKGGWTVPEGRIDGLATLVEGLDTDRQRLVDASAAGREFAAAHLFEAEFSKRIAHMRQVTGV